MRTRSPVAIGAIVGVALVWGVSFSVAKSAVAVVSPASLRSTSASVAAFVTGTTVVFAPVVAWIWLRRRLTRWTAIALGLAVVGLGLVTIRGLVMASGAGVIAVAAPVPPSGI